MPDRRVIDQALPARRPAGDLAVLAMNGRWRKSGCGAGGPCRDASAQGGADLFVCLPRTSQAAPGRGLVSLDAVAVTQFGNQFVERDCALAAMRLLIRSPTPASLPCLSPFTWRRGTSPPVSSRNFSRESHFNHLGKPTTLGFRNPIRRNALQYRPEELQGRYHLAIFHREPVHIRQLPSAL